MDTEGRAAIEALWAKSIAFSTMSLKPFSLTHVVYSSDDALGPFWALLSLSPPFCVVSLTTVIVVGRDLRAAFVLVGLIVTSTISTILKKIIDHKRPDHIFGAAAGPGDDAGQSSAGASASSMLHVPSSQEEGMPSNHAAFVAFAAAFALLFAIRRCDKMQGSVIAKSIKRWAPPIGAWAIAIGCSYSRVHLGYHTPNQVYAGFALGCTLGGIWYRLYETRYMKCISMLEDLLTPFDVRSPHEVGDLAAERRKGLDARRKLNAQRKSGWKKM